jgi:ankyrin repeat protein
MKRLTRISCAFLVLSSGIMFDENYIFGMQSHDCKLAAQFYYEELVEHQLAQQQITIMLNSRNPNFAKLHRLVEQEAARVLQTNQQFLNNYLIACLSNRVLTNNRVPENLLKLGADPNCRYLKQTGDRLSNRTALMLAVSHRRYFPVVDLLLYEGADATAYDDNGDTALILAVQQNSLEMVTSMVQALENAAYVQARSAAQVVEDTWLTCPTEVIATYIEPFLSISYQCINHQNSFRNNALIYAATHNNYAMVHYLLKNEADAMLKNAAGQTAYDLASDTDIKALLHQHMQQ